MGIVGVEFCIGWIIRPYDNSRRPYVLLIHVSCVQQVWRCWFRTYWQPRSAGVVVNFACSLPEQRKQLLTATNDSKSGCFNAFQCESLRGFFTSIKPESSKLLNKHQEILLSRVIFVWRIIVNFISCSVGIYSVVHCPDFCFIFYHYVYRCTIQPAGCMSCNKWLTYVSMTTL